MSIVTKKVRCAVLVRPGFRVCVFSEVRSVVVDFLPLKTI